MVRKVKVLFAFNNEGQVNSLVDFYKKTYGEKLEVTKVYFFRSLIDTLRKNKNFDRIVIHEELEPFGSKNQDAIDKYLFNNLDKASDEAGKADIILVCTERRQYSDKFVKNLFNIGIYNFLTGQDRTFGKVSELINKPRTKKEAKTIIDVDVEENPYEANEKVDELELRNIIKYYEQNVNNREKIVAGFESLYEQYSFEKLKQIVPFLPIKSREILEQSSQKYIALMSYKPPKAGKGEKIKIVEVPVYIPQENVKNPIEPPVYKPEPIVEEKPKVTEQPKITEEKPKVVEQPTIKYVPPVIEEKVELPKPKPEIKEPEYTVKYVDELPKEKPKVERVEPQIKKFDEDFKVEKHEESKTTSGESEKKVQKFEEKINVKDKKEEAPIEKPKIDLAEPKPKEISIEEIEENKLGEETEKKPKIEKVEPVVEAPVIEKPKIEKIEPVVEPPVVEKPKVEKVEPPVIEKPKVEKIEPVVAPPVVEKPKVEKIEPVVAPPVVEKPKVEKIEPVVAPPVVEKPKVEKIEPVVAPPVIEKPKVEKVEPVVAPPVVEKPKVEEPQIIKPTVLPKVEQEPKQTAYSQPTKYQPPRPMPEEPRIQTVTQVIEKEVIKEIYDTPRDYKKAVCFIGAHKTGTTFIINAVANVLAGKGIKVAILDLTNNKDSYLIYTNRDLDQKDVASNSLNNLSIGQNRPFKLGNLSIYTGIPRINNKQLDVYKAIEIAKRENSVILIDCDFTTKKDVPDVFRYAQSIYVVQDMDALNVLPITMFLKELKNADVDPTKISVIVNKYMKSSIKIDDIVGPLAYYTSPDFSVMEEGLLPKNVKKFIVPFDEQNYLRYVENISSGKMNFSGFSEDFKQAISIIIQDIFPIGTRPTSRATEESGFIKGIFKKR